MANNPNDNHLRDVGHVPKFDGSNYREWNYELRMMFQQLGLLGLVEGRVGHTLPVEVTHVNLKTHVTQLRLSFIHTCQLQTHVKFKHMFNCNTCGTRHTC
jgi:hypothetical protein